MNEDIQELLAWLESVSSSEWIWFVKYIAANDTYAKPNVHQGGPYISKELVRLVFPQLYGRREQDKNPDLLFQAYLDSHNETRDVRVVYYNSKIAEGKPNGRDEVRMTRWGGADFPLVAADATGSLVVFAYHAAGGRDADGCRVWICRSADEEDTVLSWVGPVEPGAGVVYSPVGAQLLLLGAIERDQPCTITEAEFPAGWQQGFPTGEAIIDEVVRRLPSARRSPPDQRLLERRDCEYSLFRSVEAIYTLPRIEEGFSSVDIFVDYANTVTNRRKSRAGRSLELHARRVFDEEALSYSHGEATEERRTPDFVFPSIDKYRDPKWSSAKLRMLAAKTTCKDRWRQILNEAARVEQKHLLTLQEGVSVTQFREMQQSNVVLVVPAPLVPKYPAEVQPQLLSLGRFIEETRAMAD